MVMTILVITVNFQLHWEEMAYSKMQQVL